jgi:cyclohexanone monooxygenase
MESFNVLVSGGGDPGCPVDDGWARFARHQLEAVAQIPEDQRTDAAIAAAAEKADFEWNEMLRARVDSLVKDPHKAAALKAYYRTGCKRPGFSDDYLPAFNQDNVSIVDTASTGIERITESGVVVDGVEHELDCLIFATGFELGTSWRHQAGYDIVGRGGVRLSDKWEKGIRTFHGFFSHDFPNMLFMGLTQTGTTTNVPHMLQEQVKHLTYVISECNKRDITSIEATVEAEDQWLRVIAAKTELRREFQMECTPGYFNNEGRPEDTTSAIGSGMYLPSMEFFDLLAKWREEGNFEGLAVSR